MTSPNPYQPPTHDHLPPQAHPDLPDGWVACPQCRGTNIAQPSFTWWGGAIGAKLLSHVKCQTCGTAYNAKTGKSNLPAIILYQVVAFVLIMGLLYALGML